TTVLHAGPIRAALEQQWTLAHLARPAGSAATLTLRVSLDAASPVLRISVRGENLARDHRLRLVLSTGVSEPEVWADAAFGPVRRAPIEVPPEDAAMEVPPRTAPLHRYLSLFGAAGGATLYSDGLAEYEVLADGRIAVTLVRAVGELSRLDLPERPGNAGWPTPTPGAQCLHPFEAELALLLHGGHRDDETMHLIECTADDVLLPLTGRTLRSAIDVRDAAGIALEGEGLAFSAMKDAADGDWVVLRCVNLLDHPVQGRWRSARPFVEAQLARLDETPRGALPLDGDTIPFVAGPRAVVTILAR
ncbi:MAG TPA: hypothetical protein VEA99_07965, partial [Gemmatimonadaceae bacterium]|nr:hypothetical protein [Gemmatimonadaceae bacterium]